MTECVGVLACSAGPCLHAGADGHAAANGNPAGALANVDEKELAQRDAHIRSFAIAQVRRTPLMSSRHAVRQHCKPSHLTFADPPDRSSISSEEILQ